jgi:hypothetical protein
MQLVLRLASRTSDFESSVLEHGEFSWLVNRVLEVAQGRRQTFLADGTTIPACTVMSRVIFVRTIFFLA